MRRMNASYRGLDSNYKIDINIYTNNFVNEPACDDGCSLAERSVVAIWNGESAYACYCNRCVCVCGRVRAAR